MTVSVSVKPGIDEIGPADNPIPQVPFDAEPGVVHVVAYKRSRPDGTDAGRQGKNVACVVMEPVIENLGIVLPDAGYLADVRDAVRRPQRAADLRRSEDRPHRRRPRRGRPTGRQAGPDHAGLSIGGGLPLAVFGGTAESSRRSSSTTGWRTWHLQRQPLCMAAAAAVDRDRHPQALAAAEQVNDNAMEAMDAIIREYELPAHTVGFGVKGAVTGHRPRSATTATTS